MISASKKVFLDSEKSNLIQRKVISDNEKRISAFKKWFQPNEKVIWVIEKVISASKMYLSHWVFDLGQLHSEVCP